MSITLIIANILSLLAFIAHTFVGDKELRLLEPQQNREDDILREKWTMSRGGWHMVSVDLLLATIGLALLNFTDLLQPREVYLQLLAIYFLAYGVAWFLVILISTSFKKNYLRLGQWMLLLVIAGL
ncbi:MAG: hypothetical protein AAF388_16470, partial [Bacteroidota bacterium]